MAHEVMQAPADLTVVEALRWGQCLGFGGSPELARAILATRVGRSFEHEEFWSTVIQFLARQKSLKLELFRPIIVFLLFRLFEPQEIPGPDGGVDLPLARA